MTIRFAEIGTTTVTAVSDSSVEVFDAPDLANSTGMKLYRLLVSSDVAIHLQTGADATPAASPRIPAETIVEVTVRGGQTLNAILASGESDGSVWVTLAA